MPKTYTEADNNLALQDLKLSKILYVKTSAAAFNVP